MVRSEMYRWPEQLPVPLYNYTYEIKNAFMRTPMQSGRARHRLENEVSEVNINVQWKIPRVQMDSFLFFIHELVGKRSSWGFFELPIMLDGEMKLFPVRFIDPETPYTSSNDGNKFWLVSARLEVLGFDTISEDDFWKKNPITDYSIIDIAVNELLPICEGV